MRESATATQMASSYFLVRVASVSGHYTYAAEENSTQLGFEICFGLDILDAKDVLSGIELLSCWA
jgi:hypothetical protein